MLKNMYNISKNKIPVMASVCRCPVVFKSKVSTLGMK